jgi:UDP-N-acetylmuramyl pentapeptide phosphotransferase/UDP-N-acetylglucosamine-1-phosphate transferase
MNTLNVILSIVFAVLSVVYFFMRRAVNKHSIVRIDHGRESTVVIRENKQSWTPTILGIAIVVAIIALVTLTSFDCINYTR